MVMAGRRICSDGKERISVLKAPLDRLIHAVDRILVNIVAEHKGHIVALYSGDNILEGLIGCRLTVSVSARYVPVHIIQSLLSGLCDQFRHNSRAVPGAHRIGASSGESENGRRLSRILLDYSLLLIEIIPVRIGTRVHLREFFGN